MCRFEKPQTSPNSLSPSTTVLSPYVTFGCLSARLFWWKLTEVYQGVSVPIVPPHWDLNSFRLLLRKVVRVGVFFGLEHPKKSQSCCGRCFKFQHCLCCRGSTLTRRYPSMASSSGGSSSTLPVLVSPTLTRWRATRCVLRWIGTKTQSTWLRGERYQVFTAVVL